MDLYAVIDQVVALLQQRGRLTYRALQYQFNLDDAALSALKEELIEGQEVALDKDGKMLVWASTPSEQPRGRGEPPQAEEVGRSRPTPAAVSGGAERRQLTVMFCDLVDSTALSAQLDPEEYREVVRAYQETCTAVIRRYDGHVAQHLGDGLLVYFGYPLAHEDDARRAVRGGLEIVEALKGQVRQQPLQVRIGIHTGLVVVGEIGSSEKRELLALGETPNLAARIQGTAKPDEVVISAATDRLVEGLFECEERGQPALNGVATPLTLYHVLKEGDAQSRFQVVVRRGLTPLVGREHEYGLLRERWQRVKGGEGQVVLLNGEPGIGKSRLVEALKESVEHEGSRCLELRCSPYAQNSALHPVIEHLHRVLQFRPEDAPEEKLRRLVGAPYASLLPPEALPLLAALLSLPHPDGYPPLTLSPQKQKEKTQEALVAGFCAEAKQHPVVHAWEDLHWADPSTLELLTLFLNQVPTIRLLAVLTYRPQFTPPWGTPSYLSPLTLSRLGRTDVEMMVEKVTSGKALPREVMQQIASKTDGVPLFVEELTKMVVESELVTEVDGHYELSGPLPPLAIPSTLQDSLMARLDRLATARQIAQIGATLGREFDYALLQAIALVHEDTLKQQLQQLVAAELVYQSGLPPQARYLFKHALVQETAYQSLLKSRRQQLHQRVAQVLEAQFPEMVESQPEVVAHHYTEAGLTAQALPYYERAGERARQRSAHAEAISHLTKGLELLLTLPDTPERAQQELPLQIALGVPLMVTKGYASPELERAYTRARELCREVGELPQLFSVLAGLWVFYEHRPEYNMAHELAEHSLREAQRLQDPARLMWGHYFLGETLRFLGQSARACVHLEKALTLYDPAQHRALAVRAGGDAGTDSLSELALALWSLGHPAQALQRLHEALAMAREVAYPFNSAAALAYAAWLHSLRRDGPATKEWAEATITLSRDQRFPYWLAIGTILRGWALVEQGQGAEGLAQLDQGLGAYRAISALDRPHLLGLLAEAHGKVGQSEEGLRTLDEALLLVNTTGERFYEAELYRLKGTLTLQSQGPSPRSKDEGAEECFWKAIEVARSQSAKSLELRAVMSLSRLWQQQGKKEEARQMLAEVYGWFTEGFDTKDLQEAKVLLAELT